MPASELVYRSSAHKWSRSQQAMRNAADQVVRACASRPRIASCVKLRAIYCIRRRLRRQRSSYVPSDDALASVKCECWLRDYRHLQHDHIRFGQPWCSTRRRTTAHHGCASRRPGDPQRFITARDATCDEWVRRLDKFDADTTQWADADPSVPASQWTPERQALEQSVQPLLTAYANDTESAGRQSGNPVLEDFAFSAALYLRAYLTVGDNYKVADGWLSSVGFKFANLVSGACLAVAGRCRMTIPRPTGEYKSQMTTPPEAWPEADEDAHGHRAGELLNVGLKLDEAAGSWLRLRHPYSMATLGLDGPPTPASNKVQSASDWMHSTGELLSNAIAFHRSAYESIKNAKEHIVANCDAAQKVIDQLKSMSLSSKDDQQKRDDAIKAIVDQALKANSAVVSAAGTAITAGQVYPPVSDKDVPDFGNIVPTFTGSAQGAMGGPLDAAPSPSRGGASSKVGETGGAPPAPEPPAPADHRGGGNSATGDKGADAPGTVATPTPLGGRNSTTMPASLNSGGSPAGRTAPPNAPTTANPMSPNALGTPAWAAAAQPEARAVDPLAGHPRRRPPTLGRRVHSLHRTINRRRPTLQPPTRRTQRHRAPQAAEVEAATKPRPTSSPRASPPPERPNSQPFPLQRPPHPRSNLWPHRRIRPHPLPSSTRPARQAQAVVQVAASQAARAVVRSDRQVPALPCRPRCRLAPRPHRRPRVRRLRAAVPPSLPPPRLRGPASTPPRPARPIPWRPASRPMPVSAARMERDAVVSASTAGAMHRQRGNANAALIQARRIAAALNMAPPQYGFFWVTGLAADGSIVVANSFGLGYIPETSSFPHRSLWPPPTSRSPPTERAKWVDLPDPRDPGLGTGARPEVAGRHRHRRAVRELRSRRTEGRPAA